VSHRISPALAALVPVAVALVGACSPTTYDESLATQPAAATTSTLPTGTAAELLPPMLDEVAGLSAKVSAGEGAGAAASRIEQYWAAIEGEVTATHPEMVEDFEFVVSRCRSAADFDRPADADRAYRNLESLVDAYLD
jgi:hypothetical protein